jgi:5-hydroxyisourate hydrolase
MAGELAKINQMRLRKLLVPPPEPVRQETPQVAKAPEGVDERATGSGLTTHVLDAVKGEPAGGVAVRLEHEGRELGRGITDADGRLSDFGVGPLGAGVYRLVFETEAYLGQTAFFPEVVVTFRADGRRPRYHVPLLLSAYSYSTYRGS